MSLPRCFGVLGHPVAHSKSPAMHAAAFEALGLPHRYLPFEVPPETLGSALVGASALGFGGLNLTVPLKTHALPLLDRLDPGAAAIGAVNTVCFTPRGSLGRNTDGAGFLLALGELLGSMPARAVVLGGGGASRAVVHALLAAGIGVAWVCRSPQNLPVWSHAAVGYGALAQALADTDLLVNGTTVGMAGGPEAFPVTLQLERLPPHAAVADLVYPRTQLVAEAASLGLRTMDGLPMLWGQGVLALQHWLGVELGQGPRAAMRRALGI